LRRFVEREEGRKKIGEERDMRRRRRGREGGRTIVPLNSFKK
jgi:hypothetical protein